MSVSNTAVAKGCAVTAAVVALIAGSWALGGFVLMLVAGAAYAEFNVGGAIGFWPSVGIYVGVALLVSFFRRGKGA